MKSRWMRLAGVGLIVASGAIAPAQAGGDKKSVTLFTPRDHADHFICGAVNVSSETLGMTFAILGDDGNPLPAPSGMQNPTPEGPVPPGNVGEIDIQLPLGSPDDGYCEVEVTGTGNANDVRVSLGTTLTRTIPGTNPPVPVFVTRVNEGH